MYLLIRLKNGISALEQKRQLGISYKAACRMKYKLLQVMKERDDKKPLSGIIQLDDAYWAGNVMLASADAVQRPRPLLWPLCRPVNTVTPIAMRFTRLKGFRKAEITQWAQRQSEAASLVVSDGLSYFSDMQEAGCQHEAIVTGGGPQSITMETFTWINTMIGYVKKPMHGSYYAISDKHLLRNLVEFCYRFNRRVQLEDMIPRLCYATVRTPPMPQRLLSMAESWGVIR
jgi:hypothetical protein